MPSANIPMTTFECIGCNQEIGQAKLVHPFRTGMSPQKPSDLVELEEKTHWAISLNQHTVSNCIVTRHQDYGDTRAGAYGKKLGKVWCGECYLNVGNLQSAAGGHTYHFLKTANVGFRPTSLENAKLRFPSEARMSLKRMGDEKGLYDNKFAEAFCDWYANYTGVSVEKRLRKTFQDYLDEKNIPLRMPATTAVTNDDVVDFCNRYDAGLVDLEVVDGGASDASAYTIKTGQENESAPGCDAISDAEADADAEIRHRLAEIRAVEDGPAADLPPGFDPERSYAEPAESYLVLPSTNTASPPKTAPPQTTVTPKKASPQTTSPPQTTMPPRRTYPKKTLTTAAPPPPVKETLAPDLGATPKMAHLFPNGPKHAVIHWDIENIGVPKGASVIETAKRIGYAVREALNVSIKGYFAYLDTHKTSAVVLDGLGKAGVDCIDCSANGKRGQADYRIIARALTSDSDAAVVIVSGDGDMAHLLSVLEQHGQATAIVYDKNNRQSVSTALLEATRCAIPVEISGEKSPAPSAPGSSASSSGGAKPAMPLSELHTLFADCDDAQRALLLAIQRAPEARDGGWKAGEVVGNLFTKIRGPRTNAFKPAKIALRQKMLVAVHEHGDFLRLTTAAEPVVAIL